MSEKFYIEIISPEEKIFASETSEAILPSYEGQMTLLKDHISIITFLRPGIIVVEEEKFFIEEGTVEFSDNKLLILSASAKNVKNLNNEEINEKKKDAVTKLSATSIRDKEKYLLSHKVDTLNELSR